MTAGDQYPGGNQFQENTATPRLVAENFRGLVAENIGKRFDKRPVVRSVSLAIERGEVVGLLGPNGAGKPPASI